MALSQIIAHRITRSDPNTPASLSTRDQCWALNGRIEECFRELKVCVIKRLGKEYGRFSDDSAEHPLAAWLKEYHHDKLGFESFTLKAMEHLKQALDNTEELMDSFLVFAYEKLEASELLHIFVVEHNSGQFIDAEIEINDSLYLDTSGVRLAAKVDITDLYSDDIHRSANALTLLRWRGEKELSDVFTQFIGFAEKVDISADTETFIGVVSDYTKDLPDDVAHQTRKHVVDYCIEQHKMGKPVVIDELSTDLNDNPPVVMDTNIDNAEATKTVKLPAFSQFISEHTSDAKPELIPDTNQLRQFVRLSGRNNQLSMSFASSCLGESIIYDAQSDSLIIKDIPARIKSRLLKMKQES